MGAPTDPSAGAPERGSGAGRDGLNPTRLAAAFALASLGLLLLVAAGLLYGLYRQASQTLDRAGSAVEGLAGGGIGSLVADATPTLEVRTVLLQQLRDASELTTSIYTMETVVTETQERKLAGFTIGRSELLYVAHGEVRAGVDLSQLGPGDIDVNEGGITVRLPPPRILDQKIDVDRSYVYDLRQSLLAPVDPDLQRRAERFALEKIRRGACDWGILEEANRHAETTVRGLLGASGRGEVQVRLEEPDPAECPPAGAPDAAPTAVVVPLP